MAKEFFNSITPEFIDAFGGKVSNADSIVISSHISPDDDSISSVLGTYYYLVNYLKISKEKIRIMYTGEQTQKWKHFKNFDVIEFVDDIYGHIKENDLVIVLDGGGWRRFSRSPEMKNFKGYTICIDHHPTPEDKFDLQLVAKDITSCAEIVYRLFYEDQKLDKNICEILFLGISGDTGNFRFIGSDNAHVFLIAHRLLKEGGFDVQTLQSNYEQIRMNVYKALGEIMKNSKVEEVPGWPKFMMGWLEEKFVGEHDLSDNDISEASGLFTGFLKGVEGVSWGFVVTPRIYDKSSSISARSLPGSVSVRAMMEMSKFGGGHDRAAGGKVFGKPVKEAIETILSWMEKNKPQIV